MSRRGAAGASTSATVHDEEPREFLCPISHLLMEDPVMMDGQTFDRSSIETWIATCLDGGRDVTNPLTGLVVDDYTLMSNEAMNNAIAAYRERRDTALQQEGMERKVAFLSARVGQLEQELAFRPTVPAREGGAPASSVVVGSSLFSSGSEQFDPMSPEQLTKQDALYVACESDNLILTKYWVGQGAIPAMADSQGRYPLDIVLWRINDELFDYFINDCRVGLEALHDACERNDGSYGSVFPLFKPVESLTINDLVATGYLTVDGREIVFSQRILSETGDYADAWVGIESEGAASVAVTVRGKRWHYEGGAATLYDLVKQQRPRGNVWDAVERQYSFCCKARAKLAETVDALMGVRAEQHARLSETVVSCVGGS